MTEKEPDQVAGKYGRKRVEKKRHLACLQARAEEMAEEISNIGEVLKQGGQLRADGHDLHFDYCFSSGPVDPVSKTITWPRPEEFEKFLKDIRDTKQVLDELETKCRDLGI